MYVLLTGTKINAGDFLIAHSAKRLIENFAPSSDYVELPAWERLDRHLDQVNSASALILCGGPAYQTGLGSRIYPIIDILDRIKVPVISFGLGWKGIPGDNYDVRHYSLGTHAEPLLKRLRSDFKYASCRDNITLQILQRYGFDNALMTGCPAWFDPDYFGRQLTVPPQTPKIVFTPAEHPLFCDQTTAVMDAVREIFPGSQITCSFHRPWQAGEHTPPSRAKNAQHIRSRAEKLNMRTQDISGSADGILKYDRFDLHIGYRVHAHLRMLSMRKPSFLVTEDGRGRAVLETMGIKGVNAWRRPLPEYYPHPVVRKAARIVFGRRWLNRNAPEQLTELITGQVKGIFAGFDPAVKTIDSTWQKMLTFLRSLPA